MKATTKSLKSAAPFSELVERNAADERIDAELGRMLGVSVSELDAERNPLISTTLERGRGRPRGKRSDPTYERVTVLLKKETRKQAERYWEDYTGKDLSELLECLLQQFLTDPSIASLPAGKT